MILYDFYCWKYELNGLLTVAFCVIFQFLTMFNTFLVPGAVGAGATLHYGSGTLLNCYICLFLVCSVADRVPKPDPDPYKFSANFFSEIFLIKYALKSIFMDQKVKQYKFFLSIYGFYTHQKSWYRVIYLGQDPDPDPVPDVRIQIRPKRSRSDRIWIHNTACM
jgi:hypothetical protein